MRAVAVLCLLAVFCAAVASLSCSDKAGNPCTWQNTCQTCNRLAIGTLTVHALSQVHDPNGYYEPGAIIQIIVTGKMNFPNGEKLIAGAWTATFYETNRQEPKIYTLTGDLPSSIVINPDSTFTLTAYSGSGEVLTMPPQEGDGIFMIEFYTADQDHVNDFYTEIQYNFTQQALL